ncbi:MAG: hypothetical protein KJ709_03660 [Nanoarchaeota archaeon]|nr:hypothetical protein [Nanoarchaeota archaeon]
MELSPEQVLKLEQEVQAEYARSRPTKTYLCLGDYLADVMKDKHRDVRIHFITGHEPTLEELDVEEAFFSRERAEGFMNSLKPSIRSYYHHLSGTVDELENDGICFVETGEPIRGPQRKDVYRCLFEEMRKEYGCFRS